MFDVALLLLTYGIRSEWRSRRRTPTPASADEGLLDIEAEELAEPAEPAPGGKPSV
jgi:hypothetical protein